MIWAGLEPGDYRLEIPGRRDFVSGDPEEFKLEIPSGRTSLELDVPVVWR